MSPDGVAAREWGRQGDPRPPNRSFWFTQAPAPQEPQLGQPQLLPVTKEEG